MDVQLEQVQVVKEPQLDKLLIICSTINYIPLAKLIL